MGRSCMLAQVGCVTDEALARAGTGGVGGIDGARGIGH